MDQEKVPTNIPIVEHLPTGDQTHPNTDGLPKGTIGHPGEHLEFPPIEHEGKVVAAPEGHGVSVETIPSAEEVEKMLKEGTEETGHWLGELLKRKIKKAV